MFSMRADTLRGQVGGVGPWKLRVFGHCEMTSSRQASVTWGPKKSKTYHTASRLDYSNLGGGSL